jgi:hypothetical protein
MSEQSAAPVEWFQPTGRVLGVFLLTLWAVIAGFCLFGGADLGVIGLLLLLAVLTHVTLLRPRVGVNSDDLVYRQMYSDLHIPLTDIEAIRVVRFYEVTVGGQRYISPAVARTRRNLRAVDVRDPLSIYADLVEDTTRAHIADARARHRAGTAPRAIRRTWAVPEIALTVAVVIALVVLIAI